DWRSRRRCRPRAPSVITTAATITMIVAARIGFIAIFALWGPSALRRSLLRRGARTRRPLLALLLLGLRGLVQEILIHADDDLLLVLTHLHRFPRHRHQLLAHTEGPAHADHDRHDAARLRIEHQPAHLADVLAVGASHRAPEDRVRVHQQAGRVHR